jgi:transposase-like protein
MASNALRNARVKHCPICKEDLTPQASRDRLASNSTRYKCTSCGCVFEINDITKLAGQREARGGKLADR